MNLQDKLKLLRKQNSYSQEELADKMGIARQTISKWENGQAVPMGVNSATPVFPYITERKKLLTSLKSM